MGIKYSEQLERKQDYICSLLQKFGPVAPIKGMENPYYYRNKVQSVFGTDRKGNTINGIYRAGTHQIIDVKSCMIEDKDADAVLSTIKTLVKTLGLRPYDEDLKTGFLRHVLIRKAVATGQIMVVLVVSSYRFKTQDRFVRTLTEKHPQIRSILLNRNTEKTSMVLGEGEEKIIYGDGFIEDILCGLRFRISAKSFYQVNHTQAEKLFTVAMRMARFSGNETVIDAYCGTGTIGLIAAKSGAKSVLGIELNPSAVADAERNASLNNIQNASFICGDAGEKLKELAKQKKSCDVLFMDPPRAGSDERFLASVIKLSPKTLIYISCNPETLERDLRYILKMSDYRVVGFQGVDMFPQTDHIETVILLNNLKSGQNRHISVDVDMDEYRKIKKG